MDPPFLSPILARLLTKESQTSTSSTPETSASATSSKVHFHGQQPFAAQSQEAGGVFSAAKTGADASAFPNDFGTSGSGDDWDESGTSSAVGGNTSRDSAVMLLSGSDQVPKIYSQPALSSSQAASNVTSPTVSFHSQQFSVQPNQILEKQEALGTVRSSIEASSFLNDFGTSASVNDLYESGTSSPISGPTPRDKAVMLHSGSGPVPKKPSGRSKMCAVCGFVSSTFHLSYGASACLSCRAFFRRIVNKGTDPSTLVCNSEDVSKEDLCLIHFGQSIKCMSCRFRACLGAGMRTGAVLDEARKEVWFRRKNSRERDGLIGRSQRSTRSAARRGLAEPGAISSSSNSPATSMDSFSPDMCLPVQVTDQSLPAQVINRSLPVQVTDPYLSVQVKDQSLSVQVTDPYLSVQVKDRSLSVQVKDPYLPAKVTHQSLPAQVIDQSLSVQVIDRSLSVQVKDPYLPVQVTDQCLPSQVTEQSLLVQGGNATSRNSSISDRFLPVQGRPDSLTDAFSPDPYLPVQQRPTTSMESSSSDRFLPVQGRPDSLTDAFSPQYLPIQERLTTSTESSVSDQFSPVQRRLAASVESFCLDRPRPVEGRPATSMDSSTSDQFTPVGLTTSMDLLSSAQSLPAQVITDQQRGQAESNHFRLEVSSAEILQADIVEYEAAKRHLTQRNDEEMCKEKTLESDALCRQPPHTQDSSLEQRPEHPLGSIAQSAECNANIDYDQLFNGYNGNNENLIGASTSNLSRAININPNGEEFVAHLPSSNRPQISEQIPPDLQLMECSLNPQGIDLGSCRASEFPQESVLYPNITHPDVNQVCSSWHAAVTCQNFLNISVRNASVDSFKQLSARNASSHDASTLRNIIKSQITDIETAMDVFAMNHPSFLSLPECDRSELLRSNRTLMAHYLLGRSATSGSVQEQAQWMLNEKLPPSSQKSSSLSTEAMAGAISPHSDFVRIYARLCRHLADLCGSSMPIGLTGALANVCLFSTGRDISMVLLSKAVHDGERHTKDVLARATKGRISVDAILNTLVKMEEVYRRSC